MAHLIWSYWIIRIDDDFHHAIFFDPDSAPSKNMWWNGKQKIDNLDEYVTLCKWHMYFWLNFIAVKFLI